MNSNAFSYSFPIPHRVEQSNHLAKMRCVNLQNKKSLVKRGSAELVLTFLKSVGALFSPENKPCFRRRDGYRLADSKTICYKGMMLSCEQYLDLPTFQRQGRLSGSEANLR